MVERQQTLPNSQLRERLYRHGGPGTTLNSTLISLDASGSLLIGTSTIPLHIPTPAVISTDGQIWTVEQGGLLAVDGVTLSSGGPGTTISGSPVNVGPGGLVIGSDKVSLPTVDGGSSVCGFRTKVS